MEDQSKVYRRVTVAVAGNTKTIRKACDAFEALTGESVFVNEPGLLSLFEMLVLAKVWHDTLGHFGDEKRMQELLQDFISHTRVKGE